MGVCGGVYSRNQRVTLHTMLLPLIAVIKTVGVWGGVYSQNQRVALHTMLLPLIAIIKVAKVTHRDAFGIWLAKDAL